MQLSLEYLPADLFGLTLEQRAALADAGPADRPGLRIPRRLEAIAPPTDRLDPDERALLVGACESVLTTLEPHIAVLDAVRSLAEPGASVVVVTEPPGFLGGTLRGLHGVLHAVRLARDLAERWKRPVVPLLWNDADEHDRSHYHATFVNENLDLRRVALAGMGSGRQPLSRVTLHATEHRLSPVAELLRQLLPDSAHRDRLLEIVLPRSGETPARAFTRAMTGLAGPLGLVVVEPEWFRADLSRALARVVASVPARRLADGPTPPAAPDGGDPHAGSEPLLYRVETGGRRALRRGGDGYRYDGEAGSRTPAELAAEIVQEPDAWSAGPELLPLVQDLVLPVGARVGGWDEWAVHRRLAPWRAARGLPAPAFVPRLSCTLVDPECASALQRLGIGVRDLAGDRVGRSGAGRTDPSAEGAPSVADTLREISDRSAAEVLSTRARVEALDRGLAVHVKQTASRLRALVADLALRVERVERNRTGKHRRHERRVLNTLVPRGRPQEVELGVLPFVARHGTAWLERLVDEIDALPTEHLVVRFGAKESGARGCQIADND